MFFSSQEKVQPTAGLNGGAGQDIRKLEEYVAALTEGNYAAAVPAIKNPELQGLCQKLKGLAAGQQKTLADVLLELDRSVYDETRSSETLNGIALEHERIMQILQEIVHVVDEMAGAINTLAASATETSRQTEIGREAMKHTEASVQNVAGETANAQSSLQGMDKRVGQLSTSTANIDQLVAAVNGIAEQTNLLSLNASIEAARAGEHGRGFSVVASEVRKLAEQSKDSVGEISAQLTNIRSDAEKITAEFSRMGQSFAANAAAVQETRQHTGKLAGAFDGIGEAISRLAPMAEEQSAAFEEMNASLHDSIQHVQQMNDATKECNHDIYLVLKDVNALRTRLGTMQLSLPAAQIIDLAKTDHVLWRVRIQQMLWGNMALAAADVANPSVCRLGKWYHAAGERYASLPAYKHLGEVHVRFHETCAAAIRAYQEGQQADLQKYMVEIDALSTEVIGLMDELKKQI